MKATSILFFIFFSIFTNQAFGQEVHSLDKSETVYVSEEEAKLFQGQRDVALASAAHTLSPTRDFSIIITKEGFYPSHISLFQGERARFFVTNLSDEPACVIVARHNVFLAAEKGKVTEGEAYFGESGTFPFYCPSTKHNGKISVIEKKRKVAERKIASESDSAQMVDAPWVPREK